jgi:peroxiredoxin
MDNVNVIRVGFFSPEIKIPDINGEIGDPINRSGDLLTCLLFVNDDDIGTAAIKDIETGLPKTESGFQLQISVIIPDKIHIAKAFNEKHGFKARLFCDSELRLGKAFSIVDSHRAKPSYHPFVFIIGDEGSLRYRQEIGPEGLDSQLLRQKIKHLI